MPSSMVYLGTMFSSPSNPSTLDILPLSRSSSSLLSNRHAYTYRHKNRLKCVEMLNHTCKLQVMSSISVRQNSFLVQNMTSRILFLCDEWKKWRQLRRLTFVADDEILWCVFHLSRVDMPEFSFSNSRRANARASRRLLFYL